MKLQSVGIKVTSDAVQKLHLNDFSERMPLLSLSSFLKSNVAISTTLLGEQKNMERIKLFELSNFQNSFQRCWHSFQMVGFFEAKELSHNRSENVITGNDATLFLKVRTIPN